MSGFPSSLVVFLSRTWKSPQRTGLKNLSATFQSWVKSLFPPQFWCSLQIIWDSELVVLSVLLWYLYQRLCGLEHYHCLGLSRVLSTKLIISPSVMALPLAWSSHLWGFFMEGLVHLVSVPVTGWLVCLLECEHLVPFIRVLLLVPGYNPGKE